MLVWIVMNVSEIPLPVLFVCGFSPCPNPLPFPLGLPPGGSFITLSFLFKRCVQPGRKFSGGAGEMAQKLRTLTVLWEDPGLIPVPHGGSQPSTAPVPGDLMLFLDFLRHCMDVVHRHVGKTPKCSKANKQTNK